LERVLVDVAPVDSFGAVLERFQLSLAVVVTERARPPHALSIPRLGLELACPDLASALELARSEAAAFLKKNPELRRLETLAALAPGVREWLERLDVEVVVKTPIELDDARRREDEHARKLRAKEDQEVLASVATDLVEEAAQGRLARAFEL